MGTYSYAKIELRASPRVCYILLGISCVLPTSKKICQVKKIYLQQFGIIHLPNSDLTYIRNPEREIKLYLCPSISWKLKSGTLRCYLFLFSPSHLTRNHDANRAPRAYIYALEADFSQVAKNCQVFCQTVGGVFLTFCQKSKMATRFAKLLEML